jgi:N12 class adenine-specific DNA methylase
MVSTVELKIRGLVNRTLIVAPVSLTFQWQRELEDKFREQFDVMRGGVLRTQYGQNPWQERNQVNGGERHRKAEGMSVSVMATGLMP